MRNKNLARLWLFQPGLISRLMPILLVTATMTNAENNLTSYPITEADRPFLLTYPNLDDLRRARAEGVDPGGRIMIHGLPNGLDEIGLDHAKGDWTQGCIAVSNAELDEIWAAAPDGTPIEILP